MFEIPGQWKSKLIKTTLVLKNKIKNKNSLHTLVVIIRPQVDTSIPAEKRDSHNLVHSHIVDHTQTQQLLLQPIWKGCEIVFVSSKRSLYTKSRTSKTQTSKTALKLKQANKTYQESYVIIQTIPSTIFLNVRKVTTIELSARTNPWISTVSLAIAPTSAWWNVHTFCNFNSCDICKAWID